MSAVKKALRIARSRRKKYAEGGEAFNTPLSPAQERAFQVWKQKNMPNDSGADYDQRGAYLAGLSPQANGHWQDRFKKPNHPTFSDQSQYAPAAPHGTWAGDTFVPPSPMADGGEALPDVGDPMIPSGGEFSSGNKYVNKAADIGSKIAGPMAIDVGTAGPLRRFVKNTVDASQYTPGSEEAHEAYGDVGSATGELGMSMVGSKGKPNTSGVFVGPYGAHMLRAEDRNAMQPHPVIKKDVEEAASQLRPEFQQAYKGWQQDARDAQARGMLEMRDASQNPTTSDVWKGSGWTRGDLGEIQKEIPDSHAKLRSIGGGQYVLDHPAGDFHGLYNIPPIKVDPGIKAKGFHALVNQDTRQITVDNKKNVSSVLHEIQHVIDRTEGASKPGNNVELQTHPDIPNETFPVGGGQYKVAPWQREKAIKGYKKAGKEPPAELYDPELTLDTYRANVLARNMAYSNQAGEVKPRNVQGRYEKSFRYQTEPKFTEDTLPGLQSRDKSYMPRPRKDIKIYDTNAGLAEASAKGGVGSNELDVPPNITHVWRGGKDKRSAGDKFRDYARNLVSGKAGGGGVGNFNPERASAFGLARQGQIKSTVPGRTDKLELNVPTGSYIIPADIPSALGQGNSDAGSAILNKMFNSGPYGMALPRAKSGMRVGSRKSSLTKIKTGFADGGATPSPSQFPWGGGGGGAASPWGPLAQTPLGPILNQTGQSVQGLFGRLFGGNRQQTPPPAPAPQQFRAQMPMMPSSTGFGGGQWNGSSPTPFAGRGNASFVAPQHFAEGGEAQEDTPIVAAGGEYVIHPETVMALGAGDIELGHSILDSFVKQTRAKHITTLKGLKPPKGS